ncbi:MAG: preprotein translocase subunit SecG [Alphaproteobacteria bacterium]|jgi:preprotein translocase subunit SecG
MQTVLMVVHLIIAVLLVGIILLQRTSEDSLGGLSGGSGFSGIMSVRSSATLFSRITMILATLFIINCLVLANLSLRQSSQSIVSKITVEQSLSNKGQQHKQDQGEIPIPTAQ